jgi:hypothetical protein
VLLLQVVGVRLAKQVQKQQDKLITGITNVTHVEDDLKVCWLWSSTTLSASWSDHIMCLVII